MPGSGDAPTTSVASKLFKGPGANAGKRLLSAGTAGAISYGYVKAVKHAVLTFVSCYIVARRTGASPLRHWPQLVAAYASLYLVIAPAQPIKYAGIVALTPVWDRFAARLGRRFRIGKARACSLLLIGAVILGVLLWGLAIVAAVCVARVPLW